MVPRSPSSRTSTGLMKFLLRGKQPRHHLDKLGSYHCELMSGDLLKAATNSKTPFSFFNTHKLYSNHIG